MTNICLIGGQTFSNFTVMRHVSLETYSFESNNIKVEYAPNPYSAGIDFRRQNLTSVDVRF